MMGITEMNKIMFDTTPFLASIFAEEELDKNAFGEVDEEVKAKRSELLCRVFKHIATTHKLLGEKSEDILDLIKTFEPNENPYHVFYTLYSNIVVNYDHSIFQKDVFENRRAYKWPTTFEYSKLKDNTIREQFREKYYGINKLFSENSSYAIQSENFDNSLVSLFEMVIYWLTIFRGDEKQLMEYWETTKEKICSQNKKIAEVQTTIDAVVNRFCKKVIKDENS